MDAQFPLVSVIIPNYNHVRYLHMRIESVLNQSFSNFEVIILDDASTDNSQQVISKYVNHPKISHIVLNDSNSGSTFRQWQKGVALAKGEWIWFAESDDYCESTLLAELINNAQKCSDTVLSYCQSYYKEEGKEDELKDMSFFTDSLDLTHWKHDYCEHGESEIKKYLLHKCIIPNASAVIFKKSAYLKVDKAFVNMKLCGDWMLWVQLLRIGNVAFCAKPLNYFRAHNATTRVMDTLAKRRRRTSEEYLVAMSIKDARLIEPASMAKRVADIVKEYVMSFTTKEMLKFLFFPKSFADNIPYMLVLKSKLMNIA